MIKAFRFGRRAINCLASVAPKAQAIGYVDEPVAAAWRGGVVADQESAAGVFKAGAGATPDCVDIGQVFSDIMGIEAVSLVQGAKADGDVADSLLGQVYHGALLDRRSEHRERRSLLRRYSIADGYVVCGISFRWCGYADENGKRQNHDCGLPDVHLRPPMFA